MIRCTDMPLTFKFLADKPDAIPVVAQWYFDEWQRFLKHESVVETRVALQQYMNRDRLPLMILMVSGSQTIGVAQLKFHELADMFPDKEHWLGGIYVAPSRRGQGYASALVEHAVTIAADLGILTLHLQSAARDGGLYARLGWEPVASVNNGFEDVLVMARKLVR
jgi:GNAT superfamily N-acetyltransferase